MVLLNVQDKNNMLTLSIKLKLVKFEILQQIIGDPQYTALEAGTLTITPLMQYSTTQTLRSSVQFVFRHCTTLPFSIVYVLNN